MSKSDQRFMAHSHRTRAKYLLPITLVALASWLAACSPTSFAAQISGAPLQGVAGGDPRRGATAIQSYGCGACHSIPGIAGADTFVGPPLNNWAERQYIAGKLPNQPQFLIEWVRNPQAIEPGSAMPDMGVTEQEARDISAYLYSLTQE
jgi:cytochrome c1